MGGYSLPLKNRDMFRDLKKGFQVYTLDTSDVPVFRMGNVVNVSEPRFQQPQMGQMGQYQQLQDRVIDLTVEINGSSMTYVVPESRDVAMSNNITLACSVDPIMNQLNAAKRTSSDILDSIDKHRRTLSRCSINAGLRNLITPLGEISNICSLCSIATTFLRYWIATRK